VRFRCPSGVSPQRNVNIDHGTPCVGRCADCNNGGLACDRTTNPGFTTSALCLSVPNALIDAGVDTGRDMTDRVAGDFNGSAREIGAREASSQRTFGGESSACP
jgi:hypothetical protein